MNDLLEALSIMVIARVPECLAFHVGHGERGYQGEHQQRACGEWRADERVEQADGRVTESVCVCMCDVAVCDVTGSLRGRSSSSSSTYYLVRLFRGT